MLPKGTTFFRSKHVWFTLSEPSRTNRDVLCVNLTCLDEECPDDECQVTHAEFAWVKEGYLTTVAFSRAQIWNADKLLSCLQSGSLSKPHGGDIPPATISKIIEIAKRSRELSDDQKALLV